MKRLYYLFLTVLVVIVAVAAIQKQHHENIISYMADPKTQEIALYWKDDSGAIIGSLQNLKNFTQIKNKKLLYAANAGMYMEDRQALGLFIQNGKELRPLNTREASGNFYLKPNGVFYITDNNEAVVCTTDNFKDNGQVKFATQSGPMLLIDGNIHPEFREGSANLNIRNGLGILPDNKVLFAMSKTETNFYDFASYFKSMGCKNALFLDGFVSRTYLPEKNWVQTDGSFGVIIGVTERK